MKKLLKASLKFGRIIAAVAGLVVTSSAMAQSNLEGEWAYQQGCGWRHTANLGLKQHGNKVTGQWDDGTRIRGDNGQLEGSLKFGRLYVRYCNEDPESEGFSICPIFNLKDKADYYVLNGDQLAWYKSFGDSYRKYLTLHRVIKGKTFPIDSSCPEDDE